MKQFFETQKAADACRPLLFSPGGDREAKPLVLSHIPEGTDISEADAGAKWLELPLFEQGLEIAAVMNAKNTSGHPLYDTVAVEAPRRSTKTTAILATLLGRCLMRPGYRVASTAQDGLRSRAKLKEVMTVLRQGGFEAAGLGKLYMGAGSEHILFSNGSVWKAIQPDPGAFRSDAFDAVLVDESGELDPEKAEALQAGYLPTQDTRPDSQTIIAGTPNPEQRAGLLWNTLQDLYNGVYGVGGVVYAARDSDVFADMSDPDNPVYDLDLLCRVHPGIGTLTTVEKIFSRLPKMGLEKWCAEYLCQWPRNANSNALDIDAWKECLSPDGLPTRPDKIGIAFDVAPDASNAAVVAAWRDEQGRAHFEVLACFAGSEWVPQICHPASKKYKGQLGYDSIGQNIDIADKMTRAPYRTPLQPLTMKAMIGAAARFDKEIRKKNVVQYGQSDLTEAVEGAAWRVAGTDGRLFARKASASSVCAVVAASIALWIYDQRSGRPERTRIITSTPSSR